jgi:caa(3)-type oxidase subunit IV
MSEHAGDHSPKFYVRIWAILLVLLIISVMGPMLEIKLVTLITAFGIAMVKAYLVAKNFMHLNIERRYIVYLLVTGVVFILLFFSGVAPDVMHHEGENWQNLAAAAEVERGLAAEGHAVEGPSAPVAPSTPEEFVASAKFQALCSSCHGAEGNGQGPAAAALNPKPANFTDPAFWETRTRDSIMETIRLGGAATGKSPVMPPFGGTFSDAQIGEMADYLMTLNPAGAAEPVEAGEGAEGAPAATDAGAEAAEALDAPLPNSAEGTAPAPAAEAAE